MVYFCYSIFLFLTVGLGFLLSTDANGQSAKQAGGWPPLQLLGVEKGLPQSFVSGVVPDEDGFIWVGTRDGLARYDGRHFITFQHQDDDSTSPIDNVVSKIWKGARNQLWVYYETGDIDRLDTRTGRCWHLTRHPVFKAIKKLPFMVGPPLQVDHQGNLWGILLNDGLFYCDFKNNKLTHFRKSKHGLASDTVKAVTEDSLHRLWVVTQKGISQFNPTTYTFVNTAYSFSLARPKGYEATGVEKMGVLVRSTGELMFGDRKKLIFFNPNQHTFRLVALPKASKQGINYIVRSPNGLEYLEYGGSVYQYTDQHGLTPVWHYQPSKDNLSTGLWCTGMCFDQAGVLWLGGNTLGLLRIDLAAVPLRTYSYQTAFCQDVIQQELGLSLAGHFRWPFSNETARSQSSYMMRSAYDQRGLLWLGLGDQVGYYNNQQKKFAFLPIVPSSVTASFNGGLRGLSIAPGGLVWIVTEQGKPYWHDSLSGSWQTLGNSKFFLPTLTNDLLVDSTSLWTTTVDKGLLRCRLGDGRYQAFRFSRSSDKQSNWTLLDLAHDPTRPHLLWISSYQGLICFNKQTQRYQRFTTAHGLPNNTVYSVVPDRQGFLWLSTNKGLCRFHPIHHTVLNLQTADGLPGDEFNRFHHFTLPDGRLAFGGVKGWAVFDPALVKEDTAQPTIALTDLKINNQSVNQYGIHSSLAAPVNTLPELRLPYHQNYLTFEFAALHNHQPDRATYRYQLQGYDNNWTTSNQSTANYTKLPSGRYTLRVNAAAGPGQWSPHIKELAILIQPPFWASGWAYSVYLLLTVSAVIGFIQFRTKRERERHELLLRQRQANELRQLDVAKSRFFANVSHELRTPLTLMLGPLSSVLTHNQLTIRDEQLVQTAQRNAKNLLGLVNELLDLTKLEAGKMDLHPQSVRLKLLIDSLVTGFAPFAQQKSISLTSDVQFTDELVAELDERKFRQVLTNLLANALKFTSAGGIVKVTANYDAAQLRVVVSDTGHGIITDDLPRIFDRYFQTSQANAPLEGGTGIGLALCQELVRLMQGTLQVESVLGQGSTFIMIIPACSVNSVKVLHEDSNWQNEVDERFSPAVKPTDDLPKKRLKPTLQDEAVETILIVEDNPDLRDYLVTILSPTFTVQTAEHGQMALATLAARSQPPALLISDIMMPVMDGFQLLEALKAHETYRRIPIIILTARAEVSDKLRALRIGVDDYLLKPFNEDELTARIASLLHNQRQRATPLMLDVTDNAQSDVPAASPSPLSSEDAHWLERLEELIKARLSNFNLTADELADELGISRRTFFRTVKRLTGLTPAQYLTEARFRQARLLLENRQVSTVKQVAYQVGFRQVSHFAHMYEQRFGKAPTDYL